MSRQYAILIDLLKRSRGDRSLNRFAADCGVDAGHMSRILHGKMINPPVPGTLKKIAESALNGVTYEDLMAAAGHLESRFRGRNITLLRGTQTHDEYCEYLKQRGCLHITPQLLQRYEDEQELPDTAFLEHIATAEGIEPDFFHRINSDLALDTFKVREVPSENILSFMERDIAKWLLIPENYPYIEFVYRAYKAGIPKELLNNAEIAIKIPNP